MTKHTGILVLAAMTAGIAIAGLAQVTSRPGNMYDSPTLRPPEESNPPRPWAKAAQEALPPGEPGKDYTPTVVPNGVTLAYKVIDGVKVFHLVTEPIEQEMAPGLNFHLLGQQELEDADLHGVVL